MELCWSGDRRSLRAEVPPSRKFSSISLERTERGREREGGRGEREGDRGRGRGRGREGGRGEREREREMAAPMRHYLHNSPLPSLGITSIILL